MLRHADRLVTKLHMYVYKEKKATRWKTKEKDRLKGLFKKGFKKLFPSKNELSPEQYYIIFPLRNTFKIFYFDSLV